MFVNICIFPSNEEASKNGQSLFQTENNQLLCHANMLLSASILSSQPLSFALAQGWIWTAPCPHSPLRLNLWNQGWYWAQSNHECLNKPSNIWPKVLGSWAPGSPSCEAAFMSCLASSFHQEPHVFF